MNGDGIHSTNISSHYVHFDINGDKVPDQTAWISSDDGFVAFDANKDGKINGVNELFGSLERGAGYAELAAFDENGDGKISAQDGRYGALSIWQDRNQNGNTDAGELLSLPQAKIDALYLNFLSQEVRDNKNLLGEISDAVVDGDIHQMADVYFRFAPGRVSASSFDPPLPSSLILADDRYATMATTI